MAIQKKDIQKKNCDNCSSRYYPKGRLRCSRGIESICKIIHLHKTQYKFWNSDYYNYYEFIKVDEMII